MTPEQFIQERKYLKNVTSRTLTRYAHSFKAFQGAIDGKANIIARIAHLRDRGVSPVSINTYLRCINAYYRWLHLEHGQPLLKVPRLKEEQKILATLNTDQIQRLLKFKPQRRNLRRAHTLTLLLLDTGLRISEALGPTWDKVDFDNLVAKVAGKGGKHRIVPISFEWRKLLFRWKQQNPGFDLVFPSQSRRASATALLRSLTN